MLLHGTLCLKCNFFFFCLNYGIQLIENRLYRVVGCADKLLKEKDTDANALSNRLSFQILKVMFIIFLRSGSMNAQLWKTFSALVRGWRHRQSFVALWSSVLAAFTKRVMRILYGSVEGLESVILEL